VWLRRARRYSGDAACQRAIYGRFSGPKQSRFFGMQSFHRPPSTGTRMSPCRPRRINVTRENTRFATILTPLARRLLLGALPPLQGTMPRAAAPGPWPFAPSSGHFLKMVGGASWSHLPLLAFLFFDFSSRFVFLNRCLGLLVPNQYAVTQSWFPSLKINGRISTRGATSLRGRVTLLLCSDKHHATSGRWMLN
jgi:hypothetical protein